MWAVILGLLVLVGVALFLAAYLNHGQQQASDLDAFRRGTRASAGPGRRGGRPRLPVPAVVDPREGIIRIDDDDFYTFGHPSPGARYLVCWDEDGVALGDGQAQQVAARLRKAEVQEAWVDDEGTFVVWATSRDGDTDVFTGHDRNGEQVWARRFRTNVHHVDVNEDATVLVVNTEGARGRNAVVFSTGEKTSLAAFGPGLGEC